MIRLSWGYTPLAAAIGLLSIATVLSSCSTFKNAYELPPEQVLIIVCSEFVKLKPLVTERIKLDAMRPAGEHRYDYSDLSAIKLANDELNGFCPPPEGFSPYTLTLRAAKSSLAVLASHGGVRPAILDEGT